MVVSGCDGGTAVAKLPRGCMVRLCCTGGTGDDAMREGRRFIRGLQAAAVSLGAIIFRSGAAVRRFRSDTKTDEAIDQRGGLAEGNSRTDDFARGS